ncbi:MAG: ATP-binding protein [Candidatus Thorarchaeota archaeon]
MPRFLFFAGATVVPTLIVIQVLRLNPWMAPEWKGITTLISLVCFGAGMLPGIYRHDWRFIKYSGLLGALSPLAVLIISYMLVFGTTSLVISLFALGVLIMLYASRTNDECSGSPSMVPSLISRVASLLSLETTDMIGAIEIMEHPESHLSERARDLEHQQRYSPFLNIVRALRSSGITVGIRIERVLRRTRVFYLTRARSREQLDIHLASVEAALRTYLPGFLCKRHDEFNPSIDVERKPCVSAMISGEVLSVEDHRQTTDGLTAAASILQSMDSGIVQIWADPISSGWIERWWVKREYENELSKSRKSIASSNGNDQESIIRVDTTATTKAARLRRKLLRLRSDDACNVGIFMTSWDSRPARAERNALHLGQSIVSSVRSADPENGLKVVALKKRPDSLALLNGHPVGRANTLLTSEVATLFIPPRRYIGIKTSRRQAFSNATSDVFAEQLAPEGQETVPTGSYKDPVVRAELIWKIPYTGKVIVGFNVLQNGEIDRNSIVSFDPFDLERHMMILGASRSGKSTTVISITAQLIRCRLNPIVIVPYKVHDWRVLKTLFPQLRIFTAGDPNTAPLYINFWVPPKGVSLEQWIQRLAQIFHAWLPNEEIMTMHFAKIIYRTYQLCGWNVEENKHGRPILLSDFYDAVQYAIKNKDIDYSDEVNQNFIGALLARLDNMFMRSAVVGMFNTQGGMTFDELLSTPTIIEMEKLHELDKTLLAGILTAGLSEYRMANPVRKLTNVLILEEAHTFLKRAGMRLDGKRSATEEAIENLVLMLRTSGGTGLGIIMLDHLASQMVEEAVKLPSNIIVHSQRQGTEAKLAGDLVRCDELQSEHITGMDVGEAIVLFEHHKMPRNIKVIQLKHMVILPLNPDGWTDTKVKESMAEFYESNEERMKSEELAENIRNRIDLTLVQEHDVGPMTTELEKVVTTPECEKVFRTIIKKAEDGDSGPTCRFMLKIVDSLNVPVEEREERAIDVLAIGRATFGVPVDDALFQNLVDEIGDAATA